MCGLLLFFSCTTDEHESPISDFISINIQSPKVNYITKAVASTPQEDNIEHIDILIFDRYGNLIPTFGKQRFTGSEITGGKISLRTDKTISPQDFYAVANAEASSITNISTLAQLKGLQLTNTTGLRSPFKMVGQHEGVDVNIPSPNVDIQLQRTMARIDIKLIPSISNFELINAEIRNTRNTTFLFPNSVSTGSLIDIKNPIQADDTKNHTAKLYSFENNNTNLNDIANTTCVVIGGYYNGDRSKLTYYRLDVLTSDNKARVDKGVCYTLTVTDILGKGWDTADDAEANKAENLIYKVDHWVEDNSNIVFDGENYISLAERKLNVIRAGGNIIIGLNASDINKVTTENNGDIAINSITINPSSKNATINIGQNNTGRSLSGNIIFKLGRLSYTLPIYQYAQDHLISLPTELIFERGSSIYNFTPRLSAGWRLENVIDVLNTDNTTSWLEIRYNTSSSQITIIAPTYTVSRAATLQVTFIHEETQEREVKYIQVLQKGSTTNKFYISASTNTNSIIVSGTGEYSEGQRCILTAPNIAGYNFSHWEENGVNISSNPRYEFTVSENRTLIATYTNITYNLNLRAVGNGSVYGDGTYKSGESVRITASPSENFIFEGWFNGSNKISSTQETTIIMDNHKSLVAHFSRPSFEINPVLGTGLFPHQKPDTEFIIGGGLFPNGDLVTLEAPASVTVFVLGGLSQQKFKSWESYPKSYPATNEGYLQASIAGETIVLSTNRFYSFIADKEMNIAAVY